MAFALARALVLADAVAPSALADALFLSATRGTSLVRALLSTRAVDVVRLEQLLERGDAPFMRHIAPVTALVEKLPPGLCDRLLAIPVRHDPRTGTVDVAVVDARDPHPAAEIAYFLRAPVRTVRTSVAAMEAALVRLVERTDAETEPGMRALAPPIWESARDARGDPEIAIPLTRRNLDEGPVIELGPESVRRPKGEAEPILDLTRRKPVALQADEVAVPTVKTIPGPYSPETPSPLSDTTASIVKAMHEAGDRDRILDLLVDGIETVAARVAVLAVRRDAIVGWTGSRLFAERRTLRGVRLVNSMRTVLHEALEGDGARLVRIPLDAAHAPLVAVMSSAPSGQVAIAPVQTEGKPVAVIFADGLTDAPVAVERITYLARAAGESLGQLLRERRKG